MKRFLAILGVTAPLAFFALFAPGVVEELTPGIMTWDVLALFIIPSALLAQCRHRTPRGAVIRSVVFVLVLCTVWSITYYPVSRFFIMGEVLHPDGSTGLVPLSGDEPKRLVLGCVYLIASAVSGGLMSVHREGNRMRTSKATPSPGSPCQRDV